MTPPCGPREACARAARDSVREWTDHARALLRLAWPDCMP